MDALHVVLGAGQIGNELTEQLLKAGHKVRQVRRSQDPSPPRPNLERLSGDITDLVFAREAGRGATVLYHCVNARYDQWQQLLPAQNRGVLVAASTAPLVVLDNLYMYGAVHAPMTEDMPSQPCSKKGVLRARLSEELLAAHRRGDAQVTMARASDFFGPGVVTAVIFGERYFSRVLAGKAGEFVGDPDMPHSYSYGPDVATAMITLGARPEALGKIWHVPTPPATSTRTLLLQMASALGVSARLTRLPEWALRLGGLFSPVIGEVVEMTYQYKRPFILDDSRFRSAFGGQHTPLPTALAATAAWARKRFAA